MNKANTKLVTIKEVAEYANVSIATVSRIINKKGGVSQELEERVQRAIKELGYKPNNMARALRNNVSKIIGLIIPTVENPFFPSLVRGAEDAAKHYEYSVILCNSEGHLDKEFDYIKLLAEQRVDGIIFTAAGRYHKSLSLISQLEIPVVVLDRKIEGLNISTVLTNNRKGSFMATEYLIKLGIEKIVFISGPGGVGSSEDRFFGYKNALNTYYIPYDERLVVKGDFSYESGYQAIDELLKNNISFQGVFASNDLMAIGAIERLLEHGLKVPEDVSVIGYDDIPMASLYKPKLTTVRQPAYKMGWESVELLLKILSGKQDQYEERTFEPELIIRESCKRLSEGE